MCVGQFAEQFRLDGGCAASRVRTRAAHVLQHCRSILKPFFLLFVAFVTQPEFMFLTGILNLTFENVLILMKQI